MSQEGVGKMTEKEMVYARVNGLLQVRKLLLNRYQEGVITDNEFLTMDAEFFGQIETICTEFLLNGKWVYTL